MFVAKVRLSCLSQAKDRKENIRTEDDVTHYDQLGVHNKWHTFHHTLYRRDWRKRKFTVVLGLSGIPKKICSY